jgi:hypothetical protein
MRASGVPSLPPTRNSARTWHRRGITPETAERAILLGVVRKYTAWLNHRAGTPITTLRYFSELIEETGRIETQLAIGSTFAAKPLLWSPAGGSFWKSAPNRNEIMLNGHPKIGDRSPPLSLTS